MIRLTRRAIYSDSSSTINAEHLTVHEANRVWIGQNNSYLNLTNSLLVSITNWPQSFNGAFNATNSSGSVFVTVGAGSHYLADSTYRNLGTTNITPALTTDLKKMTTYAPILLTNDFTVSATLSPQAQRDTDAPDIGFHYPPLDFCLSSLNLTNSNLTLTNGVAVGFYGARGLSLRAGANLVSEGTPLNPNRLVSYQVVQEQPQVWGAAPTAFFEIPSTYSPRPTVQLRFTDLSVMAAATSAGSRQFLPSGSANPLSLLSIVDSSIRGMSLLYYPADTSPMTVGLTNSVFERCDWNLQKSGGAQNTALTVNLRNDLFWNGALTLYYASATNNPAWDVHDNSFDNVSLTQNDPGGHILKSNNGYINATSLGGSNNVVLTSFTYASGPLGAWYQSSTNLINMGSRNADVAGLYHHTVRVDQIEETNSIVDIGCHYLAIDANGNPIDSDSDGIPDYLEDRNGNGLFDPDETDWQDGADPGPKVWITEPKSNSNVP